MRVNNNENNYYDDNICNVICLTVSAFMAIALLRGVFERKESSPGRHKRRSQTSVT